MKLALVKTLWGVEGFSNPERYGSLLTEIKNGGYVAIEAIRLTYGPPNPHAGLFLDELKKAGLELIAQIHTCGGYFEGGEYVYLSTCDVDEHIASLRDQANEVKQLGAVFANVHSGHDSWTVEQATKYFEAAMVIEKDVGIRLVHETHRQRLLNTPYAFQAILSQPSLDGVQKYPKRDSWWPPILNNVAKRVALIHARVGHDEGPQISDPRASEFDHIISLHLRWWKTLIRSQRDRGVKYVYIEPEFGPPPYMPTLPHSQEPVAVLSEVVAHMKGVIETAFNEVMQE